MDKYKYLAKNVLLLTISNFGSKLLSFFLVPLYTSILTTEEYGTYDLMNTTISLLIPALTVCIIEAMVRFSLDKDADHETIFSTTMYVAGKGTLIFLILVAANKIFNIFSIINNYIAVFIALYLIMMLFQVLQSFARGIDDVFGLAVSGIVNTVIMLTLNIVFLVYLKMGLYGYFAANLLSHAAASLYLIFRMKAWKYFKFRKISGELETEMTAYSRPLVLNSVSWWINNSADRYIVTWLCGVSANGIYSVGYKIPSILSVIQTIFNQAWQLSSVRVYDPDDSSGFFKNIYNVYNFILVIGCAIITVFTRFIAGFLYANDFYEAWRYVPFLTIAIVFGALSGVIGGVFQAVKDSKIQSTSTAVGAVTNIVMNIVFVYIWGPIGAAAATAVSYALVWGIRLNHVRRYIHLDIKLGRDCVAYLILVIQTALMLMFGDSLILYGIQAALCIIILLMYYSEAKEVIAKIFERLSRQKTDK